MGPLSVEAVRTAAQVLAQSPGADREKLLGKVARQCGQSLDKRFLAQDLKRLDAALAQYHLTFNPEYQQTAVEACAVAERAMEFLRTFRPMAVGPLISGTIQRDESIQLHLFADTPELVMQHLLAHKIPYEEDERHYIRTDGKHIRVPLFCFIAEDWPIELAVFQPEEIRQPPLFHGQPQKRMNLGQLQRLHASLQSPDAATGTRG